MDVNFTSARKPYAVPANNPFAVGVDCAVGFRNPCAAIRSKREHNLRTTPKPEDKNRHLSTSGSHF
jgi:hypothetical protein